MRGRKPAPSPASGIVISGSFADAEDLVSPPDWLLKLEADKWGEQRAAIAAARWEVLVASLRAKGTLDRDNDALIEMAAGAYADWKLAEAHVAQFGPIVPAPRTGVPMHNPYKAIADAAMKRLQAAERDLGIPPVERNRAAKVERAKKAPRAADRFLRAVS